MNITLIFAYILAFIRRFLKNPPSLISLKDLPIKILGVIGIILIIFVGLFIHSKISTSSVTISEGIVGTYADNNLPDEVGNLVSDGLTSIDIHGQPQPDLAQSWKVNSNATVYTFKLKNNLYWVDGTKVQAQDMDFEIPGVSVTTPDDQTVQFKLSDSFSPFPTLLTKAIFKKNAPWVGIGPYKISDVRRDGIFLDTITLNPESSDTNLPSITVRFYPNDKTAKTGLELGEVQSLLGVNDINDLASQPVFKTDSKTNYSQLVTIFYNTKDPVLSDEEFRIALSYAAPIIVGQAVAKTSISPLSWAFNPDARAYLNNPTEAKAALGKVKTNKNSVITLISTPTLADVGSQVINAWQKAGIHAQLQVESGIPQSFQAFLVEQDIPLDPDQYSLWQSTQTQTNITNYSSPRVDEDLEDGRKILDEKTRLQKYQDFQQTLAEHPPATFLYFPKYNIIYLRKIDPELNKVLPLELPSIY